MNQKSVWLVGSMALGLALTGCGGGGSGGGSDSEKEAPQVEGETHTGVFLDSAVGGIAYLTDSGDGVTNAAGEFSYKEGETVTFYIGDLILPSVAGAEVVTPADMGNGASSTTTLNILQLLQSLDADGDPSNGISIAEDADAAFMGVGAGLDITATTFDSEVSATLSGIGRTLKTEEEAAAHFAETQGSRLVGSWLFEEGPGQRNVLTFINAEQYIIFHEHDDGDTQTVGSAEFGTYVFDVTAGNLTTKVTAQSDDKGGLNNEVLNVTLSGQTLTLDSDEGAGTFTRISSASNPMVGAWLLGEEDNLNILTFLSGSTYAIVHTNNTENYTGQPQQALSGEFGTYTYKDDVFTITDVSVDTDGDGGLYNRDGEEDWKTLNVVPGEALEFGNAAAGEEAFTFERI